MNTVEPRAAVLSEGADALVGSTLRPDQIESMEEMVEARGRAVRLPARTSPARSCVSLDLIDDWGLTVHGLDGTPR